MPARDLEADRVQKVTENVNLSLATEAVAGRSRRQEKETSGAMQSTMLTRRLDAKNRIGHIPPVPDGCRSCLSDSDLAWRGTVSALCWSVDTEMQQSLFLPSVSPR